MLDSDFHKLAISLFVWACFQVMVCIDFCAEFLTVGALEKGFRMIGMAEKKTTCSQKQFFKICRGSIFGCFFEGLGAFFSDVSLLETGLKS